MGLAQIVSKFFLVYETLFFLICLFFTRFTSMNMASGFFSKMVLNVWRSRMSNWVYFFSFLHYWIRLRTTAKNILSFFRPWQSNEKLQRDVTKLMGSRTSQNWKASTHQPCKNLKVIQTISIKGHPRKSVLLTRAPRELGLFALCLEAQNMASYSARKNWLFLPILQWFFWHKKFKHDLENSWPYSQIGHVLNYLKTQKKYWDVS